MSRSSSSSDKDDPYGAAAEETESEDTEVADAKTVSGADDFTADISSADIGSLDIDAIINASSGEKDVEAGASTEGDEVSMDELEAAEAASDSDSTASASEPKSAEEAVEEYVTVGVVTGAERVVETTPVVVGLYRVIFLGVAAMWTPFYLIQVLPPVNMFGELEGEA